MFYFINDMKLLTKTGNLGQGIIDVWSTGEAHPVVCAEVSWTCAMRRLWHRHRQEREQSG